MPAKNVYRLTVKERARLLKLQELRNELLKARAGPEPLRARARPMSEADRLRALRKAKALDEERRREAAARFDAAQKEDDEVRRQILIRQARGVGKTLRPPPKPKWTPLAPAGAGPTWASDSGVRAMRGANFADILRRTTE